MCEACPTMVNHNEPPLGEFVRTSNIRLVWITLPSADRGIALSQDQAKQLLRELEEVV